MTIQPDYVKEELLHELSESFCMHLSLIHISEPTRH